VQQLKTDLIQTYEGLLFMSSWDIAHYLSLEHRTIKKIVEMYKYQFLQVGLHVFLPRKSKKSGGQVREVLFNGMQIRLLVSLLSNTENVVCAKIFMVKDESKTEIEFLESFEKFLTCRVV
jgi:hypothetical protein